MRRGIKRRKRRWLTARFRHAIGRGPNKNSPNMAESA